MQENIDENQSMWLNKTKLKLNWRYKLQFVINCGFVFD